jgi:putative phosphoesterase
MPVVGLISDTHGFLDPQVHEHFAGVDHIIHAGDIGWPSLVLELAAIAPVTAVRGNTDTHPGWPDTAVVRLDGRCLLVHHIVRPHRLHPDLARRLATEKPDAVVFGHTHAPFRQVIDGVWFVNPGSAGEGRNGQPRSLARLSWTADTPGFEVTFIELGR